MIKDELVKKERENSLLKTLLENYRNQIKPVGGQTKKEVLATTQHKKKDKKKKI